METISPERRRSVINSDVTAAGHSAIAGSHNSWKSLQLLKVMRAKDNVQRH